MNDFETIREWFRISATISPDVEPALDRIEAEVERLRAENFTLRDESNDAYGEVERLRAQVEDAEADADEAKRRMMVLEEMLYEWITPAELANALAEEKE